MRKILFIFSFLLLVSCGSSSKVVTKEVPRYSPNFDYTPPERANPRSANITIALINPSGFCVPFA